MSVQILVLAGGRGVRMEQGDIPKVLVPLKGKPIASYILGELEKLSSEYTPIIVVGYKHDLVENTLGDKYIYALQKEQLGTAHAVASAENFITADSVLVLYGDMPFITASSLSKLVELHAREKSGLSMITAVVPDFSEKFLSLNSYGRIVRDNEGRLQKIVEYKDATDQERQIKEVNPGYYLFSTSWLKKNIHNISNQNAQGEYYLTDLIEMAIAQGITIQTLSIPATEVLGINTKEDLVIAESLIG